MNICLGKVLKKCLNLYMTKEGEPCITNYGGWCAALLQRIKDQMLESDDPKLIQKLKVVEGMVDKLSSELHEIKNPSDVVVLLSSVISLCDSCYCSF